MTFNFFELFIIHYCTYFVLKLSLIWPVIQAVSWVFVTYSSSYLFVCFEHFLTSGLITCSRLIVYISSPNPELSHFSTEPWFLLMGNGIRDQDVRTRSFCLLETAHYVRSMTIWRTTSLWHLIPRGEALKDENLCEERERKGGGWGGGWLEKERDAARYQKCE